MSKIAFIESQHCFNALTSITPIDLIDTVKEAIIHKFTAQFP